MPSEQRAACRLFSIAKDINIAKGRRAQSLELPCEWQHVGHYRLSDADDGVIITLATVGTPLTKHVCSMDCPKSTKTADDLHIMDNHNLLRAALIIKQCGTRCPAVMLLQGGPSLNAALSCGQAGLPKEEPKQEQKN